MDTDSELGVVVVEKSDVRLGRRPARLKLYLSPHQSPLTDRRTRLVRLDDPAIPTAVGPLAKLREGRWTRRVCAGIMASEVLR